MLLLKNKRANHDFAIEKSYVSGVVLTGPEVKSLRNKNGSLKGSFIKVIGNEVFLINSQISPYKFSNNEEYDPKRTRKLLLKKKEIEQLQDAGDQKGKSLIPISFELHHNKIKMKFGLGKGLKLHDKRAKLKKKTMDREMAREIKYRT